MRRHAHANWNLPEASSGALESWEHVDRALLMDIRDHLRALREIFECHNAQRIPKILDAIEANTRKPKRRAKAK